MSTDPNAKKPKRRLALMPEVLPAPTRSSGLPNPRTRTMQRLRALAAVGVGLAACGKATEDGVPTQQQPDAGRPDAYGVVDPLPRPTTSCTAERIAKASYLSGPLDAGADADAAGYDAGPNGPRFVELTVSLEEYSVGRESVTSSNAIVENVELLASTKPPHPVLLRIALQIPRDRDSASVSIAASCDNHPSTITVQVLLKETEVEATVSAN